MARPKTYIKRAALRKMDGCAEARIIQMACGSAPEGHSRWTLRLLEEKARVELDVPVGRPTGAEAAKLEDARKPEPIPSI